MPLKNQEASKRHPNKQKAKVLSAGGSNKHWSLCIYAMSQSKPKFRINNPTVVDSEKILYITEDEDV